MAIVNLSVTLREHLEVFYQKQFRKLARDAAEAVRELKQFVDEKEEDLYSDLDPRAEGEAPPRAEAPIGSGEQERRQANGGAEQDGSR